MHLESIRQWEHDHTFGQEQVKKGEKRTILVISITATMMIIEIASGILYGSMALLADGLHMASHTTALGITAFAYYYARTHSNDPRFSFGTGKVNALAGFSGAILLAVFALIMAWESINRFFNPVEIIFNQAILVAILGLLINAISVFILGVHHDEEHSHDTHKHHDHHKHSHHHDHNLRSAYLHVLADALTSLFAIVALLCGKFFGLDWMDPLMGIIGSILVARWSWGLLQNTSRILLDMQVSTETMEKIRKDIESHEDNRITDLHIWSIGPGIYNANISIVTDKPKPPEHYKNLLPNNFGIVHVTAEIHQCQHHSNDEESIKHEESLPC